jgi:hypothetical protein
VGRELVEPLHADLVRRDRLDLAHQEGTRRRVEGLRLDAEAVLERAKQLHELVRVDPIGGGDDDVRLVEQAQHALDRVLVHVDVRDARARLTTRQQRLARVQLTDKAGDYLSGYEPESGRTETNP